MGFASAATMTTALSTFVLFVGYFAHRTGVSPGELVLWGSVAYFAGMPIGKVIGRGLRAYRRLPLLIGGLSAIIAASLAAMPFVSSFAELMTLRVIQGLVTIYMEVFSNVHSFLFEELRSRSLAASISISGIPAGVAIGTSAYALASQSPLLVFSTLAAASLLMGLAFSAATGRLRVVETELRADIPGTTYTRGITWIMGFLWATIAGFNLVLAVLLPPFVTSYSPPDVPLAMQAFGYSAALLTVAAGAVEYAVGSLRRMAMLVGASYVASFIGFLLLYLLEPRGLALALDIILINVEAFAVPFIYSVPRELYEERMVAKGTWEFALLGSTFHVWATFGLLSLGAAFDFRLPILVLALPPVYGAAVSFMMPRLVARRGAHS